MTVTEVEGTNKKNVFHKSKHLNKLFLDKIDSHLFAYFCCSLTDKHDE